VNFNLTRHEKLIIIFLAATALIGFGVLRIKEEGRKVDVKLQPSNITHGKIDVEELVREAKNVNINSADIKVISTLPGIGPKLAQRIIEYRIKNGPFKDKETLKNVPGIGPRKFLDIEKFIVLE
jgi:competence ComEA-like helix-hairpin-helix protein